MTTFHLAFEIYAVSARLLRRLGSRRRMGSLSHQRMSALLLLSKNGSSSVKELAEQQLVAHSTMSRLVSALGTGGLVTISEGANRSGDGRTRSVRLTAKGRRAAERELGQMIGLLEQRIASLDDGDLAALTHAFRILRNITSSM